ncbi:hypothetical protein Pmar_PMAR013599, partial [Perkinsus marinus ATCC 50983]
HPATSLTNTTTEVPHLRKPTPVREQKLQLSRVSMGPHLAPRRPKATQTLIAEHKTLRTLNGQAYNNGPYTSSTGTN